MFDFSSSILLADIFDRMRLQLSEGLTNWLTAVWILALGGLAGLVLTAGLWGIARLISLLPGIGTLYDHPQAKRIAIGVLTAAFFVGLLLWLPQLRGGAVEHGAQPAAAAANEQADPAADQPLDAAPKARPISLLDRLWALGGTLVASWLAAIAAVTVVSRRALVETGIAIREGVLWPLLWICVVMSVFSVLGLFIVREPLDYLDSLARLPLLAREGMVTQTVVIPAPPNEFDDPIETAVPVSFRRTEIREIRLASDQRLKVRTEPFAQASLIAVLLDVPVGTTAVWKRTEYGANPFRMEHVTNLYAKNEGAKPANLQLTIVRSIAFPQMVMVPITAVSIAGVFFVYLLLRAAFPKLSAVALSTAKSEIAQPLYAILLAVGLFLLVIFVFVPYFTLASDIKMLKDSGLSLILVLCIFQAVWAASTSVSEEVEGKTALTVLSKPVSRRDFILGKFLGIAWSVGLMCVAFGLVLLVAVAFKPIYDAREGTYSAPDRMQTDPSWQNCFFEMAQLVPGLVLAYFETLIMAALSVAISTRLPMLANVIICFAIYVLGHLTPLLVQSQVVADQFPPVIFFGQLIATIFPVLDHLNIQAGIATGTSVPVVYLGWALVYCALYSTIAMLLALTLFEDRDLA
ncbi:MAG: hypothetical protein SFU86_12885 [Pirellulaceae bacterium]|nr:hypothetical protein [Pirellulaceae bacterium]